MNKVSVSRAMKEVLGWKESSYREVAHLSNRKALSEIVRRAEETARRAGFYPVAAEAHLSCGIVSEERATYGNTAKQSKQV